MRKPEQKLFDTMKRQLSHQFWIQRVENDVGEGISDVILTMMHGRRPVFVELKSFEPPKRLSTRAFRPGKGMRESQIGWHLKAHKHGLKTFVLARNRKVSHDLYLFPGSIAAMLNDMSMQDFLDSRIERDWSGVRVRFVDAIKVGCTTNRMLHASPPSQ